MDHQPTIGIIGGGQLGRMLTLAALPLGFKVMVVNPSPDSPAAQVGAEEIVADLFDANALQQLAQRVDYITVEIEHLDAARLSEIERLGKPVNPSADTIALIQDKLLQKQALKAAGLPVANFVEITDQVSAEAALTKFGGKMLLKSRLGAYDGRGNTVVKSVQELTQALQAFGGATLYAEQFVDFKKELAIMISRDTSGNTASYPVVETIQQRNICTEVLAPADISQAITSQAVRIAEQTVEQLQGAGVFGIEMFLTADGQIIINEIAPRVHNSGHYTQDANRTSQFEQHIRAISGLPLGSTDLIAPAAAMINILGDREGPTEINGLAEALSDPNVSVHLYGKSPTKVDRKMGHITATGETLEIARQRAQIARKALNV